MSASEATRKRAPRKSSPARYTPEFRGPIEGWVVNYLTANLWRVQRTMDRDDCLQEARLVFLRVARTYPGVTDAPHFMALFKTSWQRRFTDLAREDSAVRQHELRGDDRSDDPDEGGPPMTSELIGERDNDGALQVMLRQAPREVAMVLNLMLRAPQEVLDLALAGWRGRDRRMRGGGSEQVNALLGLPAQRDTLQEVYDYFRSE